MLVTLGNFWRYTGSNSGCRKGGLGLRGVAFMTVLAVLTVLESTLPSFCLSYKIQDKEATETVSAVMAASVMTATSLKLNPPPFSDTQGQMLRRAEKKGCLTSLFREIRVFQKASGSAGLKADPEHLMTPLAKCKACLVLSTLLLTLTTLAS